MGIVVTSTVVLRDPLLQSLFGKLRFSNKIGKTRQKATLIAVDFPSAVSAEEPEAFDPHIRGPVHTKPKERTQVNKTLMLAFSSWLHVTAVAVRLKEISFKSTNVVTHRPRRSSHKCSAPLCRCRSSQHTVSSVPAHVKGSGTGGTR